MDRADSDEAEQFRKTGPLPLALLKASSARPASQKLPTSLNALPVDLNCMPGVMSAASQAEVLKRVLATQREGEGVIQLEEMPGAAALSCLPIDKLADAVIPHPNRVTNG